MSSDDLSPDKSFEIINKALTSTRQAGTEAAYYNILWGTLLCIFFILNYCARAYDIPALKSISYIVFPAGGLLSYLRTRKNDRTEVVKFRNDRLFMFLWGGVGLSLAIWGIITSMAVNDGYIGILLLLFGFSVFVMGGINKSAAYIAGGILCIICAALTQNVGPDLKYLLGSAGMITGMIAPNLINYFVKSKRNT